MSNIVESLKQAVEAGINQDWVNMGFSIADTIAKMIDLGMKSFL